VPTRNNRRCAVSSWRRFRSRVGRACWRWVAAPACSPARSYAYYGRTAGCVATGNEDGVKHCAMNVLYSLRTSATSSCLRPTGAGSARPACGPCYVDEGSGGPENEFTNRNTTFATWKLLHLADPQGFRGIPAHGNQRSE
jgi:hypothetical protein